MRARRIAVNIAKLPELLRRGRTSGRAEAWLVLIGAGVTNCSSRNHFHQDYFVLKIILDDFLLML